MLIQIPSIQIPKFWEVIKFSALQSDAVKEEHQKVYCITLLQDLLSGKKLCFVGKNGDKIVFVFIVSFYIEPMTNLKGIYLNNLYSFVHQEESAWIEARDDMVKVAIKAGCKVITAETDNEKMDKIARLVGVDKVRYKYTRYI